MKESKKQFNVRTLIIVVIVGGIIGELGIIFGYMSIYILGLLIILLGLIKVIYETFKLYKQEGKVK